MDMRFGIWNVRSLCRAGVLGLVTREMNYKMDLVGVKEFRRECSGTIESGDYTVFYGRGIANHQLGTGCFVHMRIRSAVRRVEFSASAFLV